MTFRAPASAPGNLPSAGCEFWKGLRLLTAFVGFACACLQAQGTTPAAGGTSAKNSCDITDVDFDGASDVQGMKENKASITDLLERSDFDKLDCIADAARSSKARFPGGLWKLHNIYAALDEPEGHVTQEDWNTRLLLLRRWTATKPNSITAQVALAGSYVSYAWDARGSGTSDSVTDGGWKLFNERLEKAKAILDINSALTAKCPESYLVMQRIVQGQGTTQETVLLKRAISFEPSYYYYYRIHATLLLPKWYGEDGDASKFAAEIADSVGGNEKDGDILYFQIAGGLVCACDDQPEFTRMSWERIQRGFAATEGKYGSSMTNLNLFALMASEFQDSVAADAAFKRIGDNWDQNTWITETYFNQIKSWASQLGPHEAHSRAVRQEAATNEQSPEGARYKEQVEKNFAMFVRQCAQGPDADLHKFEFMLMVGKDGTPENGYMPHPTALMGCLVTQLMTAQIKKETPFPPPPHPSYWLRLVMDPATDKPVSN